MQQVRGAGPTAQVRPAGDPTQHHRRFGPQPARQLHLAFIPFAACRQLLFRDKASVMAGYCGERGVHAASATASTGGVEGSAALLRADIEAP